MSKGFSSLAASFYCNMGDWLYSMNRLDAALAKYNKAIGFDSSRAEIYHKTGNVLQGILRFDDAIASYEKAIALKHDYAKAYHALGNALASKGDRKRAEKMLLKALELKPDFLRPLYYLTALRNYQDVNNDDVKKIKRLLNDSTTLISDKEYLNFALGKIYDDCGLYDEAFEYYRQGNEISNGNAAFNPAKAVEFTDGIIDVFSKDFLDQKFSFSSGSGQPLFIVGMPRSGTTLMASILSNHRSINTAGELTTITNLAFQLPKLTKKFIPYPQAAKYITPYVASFIINKYETRLRRDITAGIPYIIDKHPVNFVQLGLISMLFPKAKIIHCTRNAMDTCLSNYFQRFLRGYDYSFDLRNIACFYNEYVRIMEHWRKVLPMQMIEVSYEDMIMNTEQTVHKMLDFLRLEWDENCLLPHTNPCAVETASLWQVRKPIYQQSIGKWRNYEKHLGPLKEALDLTPEQL